MHIEASEGFPGSEEGKGKPSRLRGKQQGLEAEGNLLDMPNKVLLKGQASAVLSSVLAGKAGSADALACQGIFDRCRHICSSLHKPALQLRLGLHVALLTVTLTLSVLCRRQLTVAGVRKWLVVDEQGDANIVEVRFAP